MSIFLYWTKHKAGLSNVNINTKTDKSKNKDVLPGK